MPKSNLLHRCLNVQKTKGNNFSLITHEIRIQIVRVPINAAHTVSGENEGGRAKLKSNEPQRSWHSGSGTTIIYGVYGARSTARAAEGTAPLRTRGVAKCEPRRCRCLLSRREDPTDPPSIRLRILLARGRIPWSHHLPLKQ